MSQKQIKANEAHWTPKRGEVNLNTEVSEMAQQGKEPVTKPEDPSSIPGTHTHASSHTNKCLTINSASGKKLNMGKWRDAGHCASPVATLTLRQEGGLWVMNGSQVLPVAPVR